MKFTTPPQNENLTIWTIQITGGQDKNRSRTARKRRTLILNEIMILQLPVSFGFHFFYSNTDFLHSKAKTGINSLKYLFTHNFETELRKNI